MRRATRAKLKRARRLLEAHILAHKGFGFSAASALLALHRGLFAEAPAPGGGARAGARTGPSAARGRSPFNGVARRHGRGRQPERGQRAEHAVRRVFAGLGPHASVDTFHTVMTDDPEQLRLCALPNYFLRRLGPHLARAYDDRARRHQKNCT